MFDVEKSILNLRDDYEERNGNAPVAVYLGSEIFNQLIKESEQNPRSNLLVDVLVNGCSDPIFSLQDMKIYRVSNDPIHFRVG